jgi:hypothetical protein
MDGSSIEKTVAGSRLNRTESPYTLTKGGLMITSEFEYYLIQELNSMPDRELAQKIELHIWYRCATPQPKILAKYLQALKESDGPEEFVEKAQRYLDASGLEFVLDETGKFMTRTPNVNPPDYIEISVETRLEAEKQEPQVE